MFSQFFDLTKANPYRDGGGKFASKDGASSVVAITSKPRDLHKRIAGLKADIMATKDIPTLRKKSGISDTGMAIVAKALPDKATQVEYLQQLAVQNTVHGQYISTKYVHSKSGNGDGYTEARRKVHRQILEDVFKNADIFKPPEGEAPTMTILGGRGGSGKSNFDSAGNKTVGGYSSKTSLVLDADKFKERLPDYDPTMAAAFHEESSVLFSRAVSIAKARGLNTVLDLTMRSPVDDYVSSFKKEGYKTQGLYMKRPPEAAAETAIARWAGKGPGNRGRMVPVDVILGNTKNEENFSSLTKKLDSWQEWDHSGEVGVFTKLRSGTRTKKNSSFMEGLAPFPLQSIAQVYKSEPPKVYGLLHLFKANPYHDANGRFTTKDKAVFVSIGPPFVKTNFKTKQAYDKAQAVFKAEQKVKLLAAVKALAEKKADDAKKAEAAAAVAAELAAKNVKVPKGTDSDPLSGVEDDLPAPKAPYPTPPSKALDKDLIAANAYELHYKEGKSMLAVAFEKANSGDISGIEALVSTLEKKSYLGMNNKALVGTLKEHIQHHADVESWAKGENYKEPSLDYLTPKKKEKALAAIATFKESYTASLEEFVGGTYSSATKVKAAAKGLVTLEKSLTKAGLSQEDAALVVSAGKKKFKEAQSEYQAKAKEDIRAYFDKAVQNGTPGLSEFFAFAEYGHKFYAAKDLMGTILSRPGMMGGDAGSRALIKGELARLKSTQLLTGLELSQATGPDAAKNLSLFKMKAKDIFGFSEGSNFITSLNALTSVKELPATYEEAHAQARKSAYTSGLAQAQQYSKYLYGGLILTDASPSTATQAALASYAQAKFGKPIDGDELTASYEAGYTAYKTIAQNGEAKIKKAVDSVKAALKNGLHAADKGLDSPAHRAEYLMAKAEALAAGVPKASLAYAKSEAYSEHAQEKSEAGAKAATDVATAMTSREVAKAKGYDLTDHDANVASVLKANAPHLTPEKIAAIKTASKAHAAFATNVDKVASSAKALYDSKSFKDVNSPASEAGEKFVRHHDELVASLSPAEKNILVGYTGPAFTALNRAAGAYGTAKMQGTEAVPLDAGQKLSMKEMDSAFAKTTLGSDVRLRRNMAGIYLNKQLGLPDNNSDITDAQLQSVVGRVYKETAYSSTSTNTKFSSLFSNAAKKYGKTILDIRSTGDKPGLRVKSISQNPSEEEVVLPRGTTYVIRRAYRDSDGNVRFELDNLGAFPDPL